MNVTPSLVRLKGTLEDAQAFPGVAGMLGFLVDHGVLLVHDGAQWKQAPDSVVASLYA